MLQVNIKHDIKKAMREVGNYYKKQVPFAVSVAMNKTVEDIKKVEQAAMRRELDSPTPSTVKGVRVQRSSKRKLRAEVFVIKPIDAFIKYQVVGGVDKPQAKAEAVPVNFRLNKYGNIPGRRRGRIAKELSRPDTFSGVVNGQAGIWRRGKGRNKHKLTLVASYQPRMRYKPIFHFYEHAQRTTSRRWPRHFAASLRLAIATAR